MLCERSCYFVVALNRATFTQRRNPSLFFFLMCFMFHDFLSNNVYTYCPLIIYWNRYQSGYCLSRCTCDELPCPLLDWLTSQLKRLCPELQGMNVQYNESNSTHSLIHSSAFMTFKWHIRTQNPGKGFIPKNKKGWMIVNDCDDNKWAILLQVFAQCTSKFWFF